MPVTQQDDGKFTFTQPSGKVAIGATFRPERLAWNPFADVSESDWFYDGVKYVYEHSLMNGTAANQFTSHLNTSRGMIVTILWRLEGAPKAKTTASFPDVSGDKYYASAIAWGTENGIVQGYGDGTFGPDNPITREQLAAILYRYAQFKGMDTTATSDLTQFNDQPSAWAAESVRWAVGEEIVSGKGGGVLDPQGTATRAEAAEVLMRFLTNYEIG